MSAAVCNEQQAQLLVDNINKSVGYIYIYITGRLHISSAYRCYNFLLWLSLTAKQLGLTLSREHLNDE
jgi:hypothetical protein